MAPDDAEAIERCERESRSQTQVQSCCSIVLRLPLTEADGLLCRLLWEAAEQIGQMRAATLFGTLTLLVTGLVLVVCCARSRSSSKFALVP